MSDRYSWNELPPLGNQEEKRDRANFDVLLHELVQYQVEKTPDAVALRYEEKQITYQELDARANQLAHILLELGVGPDVGVGIACERSVELVIGLLGILKAGGAFIPLDPSYPAQRLRFMVEDAQLALLLTQEHLAPLFSEIPVRLLYLDNLPRRHQNGADKESSSQLPPISPHPQNLAYSIYTSGSTGQPKGVLNTHQGIVNRLLWMQQAYQLDPSDCVLQKTSMSFDVAVWEFFWPLLAGASIVLARPQGHYDPAYLAHLIEEQSITTLHFVPSMLHIFLQEPQIGRCTSLRRIFCSGEALTFELEQRCLSTFSARLYNLYGPTEAAIDVTHWQCQVSTRPRVVSIGQPISNIRIFLLDRWLQPVPLGEIGELCIAGVGLARGYSARPDLTAERFLPNPLSEDPGERLYRTGDLARYLPDGNLEFLGRLDNQVKIRGFRIELEEIQATLEQHPGVDWAVVQKWENTTGDNQLAVYVLPHALRAAPVLQLLALRQKGLLTGLTVHSLPDGLTVVCQNKSEVDFLYNEIFVDQSYLQAGITLEEHDCIFDVGANIGLFTLFAGLSRPNITVY
ncbi:MAG TPA: amino acid adenylation domain-containing protein, partial [Ktedonobacteraceae bacterium]|nr:amino acid adenylation domain-containing protein [Ktedonobacteraceae bacterium]